MKNTFYMPLTATPFKHDRQYREVLPRNPELARYIRCFWGSRKPYIKNEKEAAVKLIIPDTCADIIYYIDHTENTITGSFCGVNDTSFLDYDRQAKPGHLVSVFAVRFYAWDAYGFAEDSLKGTLNGHYDIRSRFYRLDRILREQLLEKHSLEERIVLAEEFLSRQLYQLRQNDIVYNAVAQIILQKGALSAAQLAKECFVSSRQMERLFQEYIGITPKKLCNLIRYQYLWNEILRNPRFCVMDAVHRYGYADQSHLLREFKRYHTMDIRKAKMYAYQNVGNIQYISKS